ncbi:hypothetical protein ACFL2V_17865 [Pseudomonadota bacterium]
MIYIVTALQCEAKPLIKHYHLNGRQAENGFRIYENENIRLVVAGIGKIAAAAATAYLQAQTPHEQAAWLNLGVAGHGTLAVGELVLANKIKDASSQTNWYPPQLFSTTARSISVVSVDTTETEYKGDNAYEMEATGFYATACRFSSTELIQVCKIISDNHAHPVDKVSPKHVEEIISTNLEEINDIVQALQTLQRQLIEQSSPAELKVFLTQWHFTVSQQHQLQRLLQRWQARSGSSAMPDMFADARNGKTVIKELQQRLEKQPLMFGEIA